MLLFSAVPWFCVKEKGAYQAEVAASIRMVRAVPPNYPLSAS